MGTAVVSRRVVFCEMATIDVLSVLNVDFFVVFPANSDSFSLFGLSTLLVEFLKVVAIGGGFFFSVPKYGFRYGSFLSFSEAACFGCFGVG